MTRKQVGAILVLTGLILVFCLYGWKVGLLSLAIQYGTELQLRGHIDGDTE